MSKKEATKSEVVVEAVVEERKKFTLEAMNPAHAKVLKRIQDSIPESWMSSLVDKVPVAPGTKEACEKAVKDPDVSEEVKKKAQILLDSGYLDKMMEVVNPYFERLINNFIDKEIGLAVKRGELPKGKKYRNFDKKLKRAIRSSDDMRTEK